MRCSWTCQRQDTMYHDLLIAKLGAYGFQDKKLFTNRQQRVRANSNFGMREEIISGVPQGSILSSLLFGNDLFLFVENSDLSNYADNITLYSSGIDLRQVKQTSRQDFEIAAKWVCKHYMVLNSSKCHFMCLRQNETFFYEMNNEMKNSKEEKILGVIIDNKLRFKIHVKNFCKSFFKNVGSVKFNKLLKGMNRPIFCIDIIEKNRNRKIM